MNPEEEKKGQNKDKDQTKKPAIDPDATIKIDNLEELLEKEKNKGKK